MAGLIGSMIWMTEDYCRLCRETAIIRLTNTPQWGKICDECYDEKEENDEIKTIHGVYED